MLLTNPALLASVIVNAVNAQVEPDFHLELEGETLNLHTADGEVVENITLEKALKALSQPGGPSLLSEDREALAKSVADKVISALASPNVTIPIKVDASALQALFNR